ncbi:MAG TPA: NUDIX hydrolase [Capsulimonadaceae bacterium]|nr:NUDIX hydrolase [Capsulimonadaceae bacterium]
MSTNEKVVGSKRIFDGRIINLRVDTVQLPNGKTSTREIVEHRGAVAMVPMLDKETVILVRQEREPAGGPLLEIPAGTLDPDEEIEACAHRELAEEIQYKAGRMIKLCSFFTAPGYATEKIHAFLALDLTPCEGHGDEDEFLEIVHVPLAKAVEMIGTGEIEDAKSIAGLLYAQKLLPQIGG